MPQLQGMTWNHTRGFDSMLRATEELAARRPDLRVEWSARSLSEFEDTPVTELAKRYDLIAIDHPHVGQAASTGALVKMDELLSADAIAEQRECTVGPSFRSYTMDGHQWALAMDAASQVSAYRPDLLPGEPPRTWDEALALLQELPEGTSAEIPANSTHLWSTFMTLCHHVAVEADPSSGDARTSGVPGWWTSRGIVSEVAAAAYEFLGALLDLVDPISLSRNPIDTLQAMSSGASVAYSPLLFGYSNYAREDYRENLVLFADAPSPTDVSAGTMLGGVGLAVSANCGDLDAAAELAAWVVSRECQADGFVRAGGQPAHRAAWEDPDVNRLTNGFFRDTLATLEGSFVRPRSVGYPSYQRRAGELLHESVQRRRSSKKVVEELAELWSSAGGYSDVTGR